MLFSLLLHYDNLLPYFFYTSIIGLSVNINGDTMSIFTNVKKIDKYKGKTVVLNSIRTDKATAVKIDELVEVCTSHKGVKISKNQLLSGIVTAFINGIETTAKTNEDEATQQLLEVLDN